MSSFRQLFGLVAPVSSRSLLPTLALVALGLLTMGGILGNVFVQDDVGVIVSNPTIHAWSGIWRAFAVPYWPPADSGELYRPLSTAWYTVQWMVGGGAPWLFRVVSLGLYVISILLVWRLLRELVSANAAWIGAALFAVHPVHVEAVAPAVNQSEILVGILVALALLLRIRTHRGLVATRTAAIGIGVLYVLAIPLKEHALVLPGLLLCADFFLDREREGFLARWRRWRWHYAAMLLFAAGFWWVRSRVLGPGSGTGAAEALEGAGLLGRAYTMVGVPAEWLGLLLWPTRLQTDWNLLEWVPTRGWSLRETAGAIALVSFLAALALVWSRRPVAAFGLSAMIVALAPVSNVLLPTGVIIAERALYLTSIGLVIVLADLVAMLDGERLRLSRPVRFTALFAVAILLGLGMVRSQVRSSDWENRPIFMTMLALDSPTSWHARLAYGVMLADIGDTATGRTEIRRAMALRPEAPLVVKEVADGIRVLEGKCRAPILIYEETLTRLPGRSDARGSLVACLLWEGRYAEARVASTRGMASGLDTAYFRYVGEVADSAVGAAAAAGTVRLKPIGRRATLIGPSSTLR